MWVRDATDNNGLLSCKVAQVVLNLTVTAPTPHAPMANKEEVGQELHAQSTVFQKVLEAILQNAEDAAACARPRAAECSAAQSMSK